MISVSDLTKVYGMTVAVDHISFDVPQGQIVGFLGPNGAGKSTTLKILTCYLPPTSGGATIAGFNIFHQSEQVRQKLGYLPENCPLYTEMKVEEYLDFRGRLRGMAVSRSLTMVPRRLGGAPSDLVTSSPFVDRRIRVVHGSDFWLDNIRQNVIKMKHYVTTFGMVHRPVGGGA